MPDPAEKCIHCGARFDTHVAAKNGGFDCPPRADGKVLLVVACGTQGAYRPGDDDTSWERREWREPEPKDALDVLRVGQEGKGT